MKINQEKLEELLLDLENDVVKCEENRLVIFNKFFETVGGDITAFWKKHNNKDTAPNLIILKTGHHLIDVIKSFGIFNIRETPFIIDDRILITWITDKLNIPNVNLAVQTSGVNFNLPQRGVRITNKNIFEK